jgi:hypothetical protein
MPNKIIILLIVGKVALVTGASSYTTGQYLAVYGGWTAV